MNLLFASGMPHLPQVLGGIEVNTDQLAIELSRRGHQTAVLAKLWLRDRFGLTRFAHDFLKRRSVSRDFVPGYEVYRSRRPWSELKDMPMPDVVVVQNGPMIEFASSFACRGVPVVVYLHNLSFESARDGWAVPKLELPICAYIANSHFTASRFRERFGIRPHLVPPVFSSERYQARGEHRFVTFINPTAEKGVDIACAVAVQCPEIPFRFVKSWLLTPKDELRLKMRLFLLRNVELVEARSDMRSIYGATRVLLVPSQSEETWGRVATEAQFSGIPVLGSDAGGLPDTIGLGGTIIDRNARPDIWARELRRLWHDGAYFEMKSQQALAHAHRPAINVDHQVNAFLSIIEDVVAATRRARCSGASRSAWPV
jgi:glycosyltransferase involved in cell wall biosynthesis